MFIASDLWNDNVVLYSTAKIVDSQGNAGMAVKLNPPMSMVSELYFFQCSKSTVVQTGTVDCRTGNIRSLAPEAHKDQAVWRADTIAGTDGDTGPFNPALIASDSVGC